MNSDKRSQFLSLLLRHKNSLKVQLDTQGWTSIAELIEKTDFTRAELFEIVCLDKKGRYSISPSGELIRANQGHSLPHVRMSLPTKIPPNILWHGTKLSVLGKIMKEGLLPMNRNLVHLSDDIAVAMAIANRRVGTSVVLAIDTPQMVKDGVKFFISDNRIWLVDHVHPKYLSEEERSI